MVNTGRKTIFSLLLELNNRVIIQWLNATGLTNAIKKFTLPVSVKTHYSIVATRYWNNATNANMLENNILYFSSTQVGIAVSLSGTHSSFIIDIAI